MIAAAYVLTTGVSLLQTQLSHREGYAAKRMGLESMPLDQHIEGRHGERQTGVERRPDPMHDLLAVTDQCQHREHRLHQQAVLPRAALPQLEVGGIALCRMEGRIAQDDHPCFARSHQPLTRLIWPLSRGTVPGNDQLPLVEQPPSVTADHPAMMRKTFAADRRRAAAFTDGMAQLDPLEH